MLVASGYFKVNVISESDKSFEEISNSILLYSLFYYTKTPIESFEISLII